MKQCTILALIACAAITALNPCAARADVDISASIQVNAPSDFYQPLEPYGSWVDVSSHGRCWRPREIGADWQPYTLGHWEWTDAGWYWVSDEPWGWACFHYGSWYQDPSYGWVWIPGVDWAPAWVTWRYSDAYIGWAPCGPGLSVLAPSFFTFCDVHRFHDHFRSRRDFIVNNTTIINRTRVVKDFNRKTVDIGGRQRTVFENRGPGVEPIQRATGRTFTPRPVRDVIRESRQPQNLRGDDGRRRDNNNRPEPQRSRDQQRRDNNTALPPTGRDQQRNFQQPDNRDNQQRQNRDRENQLQQQQQQEQRQQQEQQQRQRQQELRNRPEAMPPTGRDQSRSFPQQAKPETPARAPERHNEITTPQQRPTAPAERPLPPTGRNEVRPAQPDRHDLAPGRDEPKQVPRPAVPEQRREVPTPARPAAPERPLPPTGRPDARPERPPTPAPPAHMPEARPAPPVRQGPPMAPGADGRGRDHRDDR